MSDSLARRGRTFRTTSGHDADAATAWVANAVADGKITVVREVLVTGNGGGAFEGLAATLMRTLGMGEPRYGQRTAA